MKRNLLSSAIIVAIMSLGLTGCDDKKPKQKRSRLPIVNLPHQLLKRNLLKLPLQKQKLNLKHLRNRWSMNKRFSTKKWMSISSATTSYRSRYSAVWRVMLTG